jgi:NAD(P)-dependent dehydrogenase (short-subunit alcohol dehydrogenase family)
MAERRLLRGKVALVTGGSRGLGAAICRALVRHGARVAFSYSKNEEAASALLEELRTLAAAAPEAFATPAAAAHMHRVSVLDVPATEAMIRTVEAELGPLDILINNAGISQNLPLALIEEDDFDRVMDVNVKGTFLTSKAALRHMIRRKSGVILNIGSLAGVRILEAPVHYCTSKAAIVGLTRSLAKEVSRHGIRVLCLAPGLLEDGLGKNVPEHRLTDYLKHCALGRVGTLDEVAEFAAFLVSPMNAYMFGETCVIDGGV